MAPSHTSLPAPASHGIANPEATSPLWWYSMVGLTKIMAIYDQEEHSVKGQQYPAECGVQGCDDSWDWWHVKEPCKWEELLIQDRITFAIAHFTMTAIPWVAIRRAGDTTLMQDDKQSKERVVGYLRRLRRNLGLNPSDPMVVGYNGGCEDDLLYSLNGIDLNLRVRPVKIENFHVPKHDEMVGDITYKNKKRKVHRQIYDEMTIQEVWDKHACGVYHNCDDHKGRLWTSWEWNYGKIKIPTGGDKSGGCENGKHGMSCIVPLWKLPFGRSGSVNITKS